MAISNGVKKTKFRSLTVNLAVTFFALVAVILIIVGALTLYFNFTAQQKLIAEQQNFIAYGAANTVTGFIEDRFSSLEAAVSVGGLADIQREKEKLILEKLLGLRPSFRQLILLDDEGRELASVSRFSQTIIKQFIGQFKTEALAQTKDAKRYVSSVYVDEITGEPEITIAIPVRDVFGDFKGVLMAEMNLKFMWDLVGGMKIGEKGLAYVVDKRGNLIAFGDISRVLKGENLIQLEEVSEFAHSSEAFDINAAIISKGIKDTYVLTTYVPLGMPDWAVIVELPVLEAYTPVFYEMGLLVLIMFLIFGLAIMAVIYLSKRITKPIIILRDAAREITKGKFDTKIEIKSKNEIGELAADFNYMTARLAAYTRELEKKVAERTLELDKKLKELLESNTELEKTKSAVLSLLEDARKLEKDLRASEQKFRDLTETTPDLIWEIDKNSAFTYISPRAKDLLGYEVSEMSNKILFDFVPLEDAKKIKKFFEEKVLKKESLYGLEIPIRHKKGHLVVSEINAIPLFDKEEQLKGYRGVVHDVTHRKKVEERKLQLKGFRGIAHDITERKKMETALLEEKNKLEKYFEVVGVIVLVISPEGRVLLINKKGCEILGHEPEEIMGKDWIANFIPEKNRAKIRSFFGVVVKDGIENRYFECPVLTKGGDEKIIAWGNTVIKDGKGEIQAILSAGGDITELKQAEVTIVQLKEFDKMKDEFLNIAAHELRTPLTSIIGLSEIMKVQKPSLLPPFSKYVEIINNEGVMLSHIIKRILTVTRFESGKEVLHIEPFNLTDFISSLLPTLNIIVKNKKSKIIINIEEKDIQITSDKEKVSEVIYNFVDNALKYGSEGQTITISVNKPKKDQVRIAVTDQGKGIPHVLQKKLFMKFSQLEPSLSRSQEGTGMGLYICKLIVEKLGGEIGVKSALGKGSSFFFTFPIAA